jgi:hypothetical protein
MLNTLGCYTYFYFVMFHFFILIKKKNQCVCLDCLDFYFTILSLLVFFLFFEYAVEMTSNL